MAIAGLFPARALAWQAGETPPELIVPVRVTEAVRDLEKLSGKMVAIIGRFSFRESGRYLSERPCDGDSGAEERVIRVGFETAARSASITRVEFDGGAVRRELAAVKRCNTLKKIRYGSTEYERWAMVYGRIEQPGKSDEPAPPPDKEFPRIAASVFCGGDAAIISLVDL
jgi:hypothetical protein